MPKEPRRHHSAEQKVAILREHLIDRVPISDVCEKHQLQPSVFYYWQKQFFENGTAAFTAPKASSSREQQQAARIEHLEARIARKDTVIAELSEELVLAKKEAGDL